MRATGKTTRIIDRCVQEFFKNGITYLFDERDTRNERIATMVAFKTFVSRMELEHNLQANTDYKFKYGEFDGVNCYKITKA